MSKGTVVQVIGAVIDVEFSKEELPKIYDALVVKEADLILEVSNHGKAANIKIADSMAITPNNLSGTDRKIA